MAIQLQPLKGVYDPEKEFKAFQSVYSTLARASRAGGRGNGGGAAGFKQYVIPDPNSPTGWRLSDPMPKGMTAKQLEQIEAYRTQNLAKATLSNDPEIARKLADMQTASLAKKQSIFNDIRQNDMPRLMKQYPQLASGELIQAALDPIQQQISQGIAEVKAADKVWDQAKIAVRGLTDVIPAFFDNPEQQRVRAQQQQEYAQQKTMENAYLREQMLRAAEGEGYFSSMTGPTGSVWGSLGGSAATQLPTIGGIIGGGVVGAALGGPAGAALGVGRGVAAAAGSAIGQMGTMSLMERQHLAERAVADPNLTPEQQTETIERGLTGATVVGAAMGAVPFGMGKLAAAARPFLAPVTTAAGTARAAMPAAVARTQAAAGAQSLRPVVTSQAEMAASQAAAELAAAQAVERSLAARIAAQPGRLERALYPQNAGYLRRYLTQAYPYTAAELGAMNLIGVPGMNLAYEQASGVPQETFGGLSEAMGSSLLAAGPFALFRAGMPGRRATAKPEEPVATAATPETPSTPTPPTPPTSSRGAEFGEMRRALRSVDTMDTAFAENWVRSARESGRSAEFINQFLEQKGVGDAFKLSPQAVTLLREANTRYGAEPAPVDPQVVINKALQDFQRAVRPKVGGSEEAVSKAFETFRAQTGLDLEQSAAALGQLNLSNPRRGTLTAIIDRARAADAEAQARIAAEPAPEPAAPTPEVPVKVAARTPEMAWTEANEAYRRANEPGISDAERALQIQEHSRLLNEYTQLKAEKEGTSDAATTPTEQPSSAGRGAAPEAPAVGPNDPIRQAATDAADNLGYRRVEADTTTTPSTAPGVGTPEVTGGDRTTQGRRPRRTTKPGVGPHQAADVPVEPTRVRKRRGTDARPSVEPAASTDAATGPRPGEPTGEGVRTAGRARDAETVGAAASTPVIRELSPFESTREALANIPDAVIKFSTGVKTGQKIRRDPGYRRLQFMHMLWKEAAGHKLDQVERSYIAVLHEQFNVPRLDIPKEIADLYFERRNPNLSEWTPKDIERATESVIKDIEALKKQSIKIKIVDPARDADITGEALELTGEPAVHIADPARFVPMPELTAAAKSSDFSTAPVRNKLLEVIPGGNKAAQLKRSNAMNVLWREALAKENLGPPLTAEQTARVQQLRQQGVPELMLPPETRLNFQEAQRVGMNVDVRALAEAAADGEGTLRKVFNRQFENPC